MSEHTSDRVETAALHRIVYQAAFANQRRLFVEYLAEALVKGDDAEHHRAVRCARALDEAGLNVDADIDNHLHDLYDMRPEWAWKPPAARQAEMDNIDIPW